MTFAFDNSYAALPERFYARLPATPVKAPKLIKVNRALAHDLASDGVTVNCVSPGLIDTVRKAGSVSARPHHHASHKTLLGRRGTAWEVAQSVVFLAGPGARYVTGQVLHANGGAYLGG